MNKFGLPQRAMDEMHAIFAKHGKVKKVVLYGSRAMGNYKNGSDIDLTMYGSALTFDDLNNIAGELEESSIPYLVDLSIFDVLDHAKLKDHIKRHGRVFYDRYAGWKTVRLGDVATIIAGQSPTGKNYNKEGQGMPFYQGKKNYGDKFLKPPTVWTKSVTKVAIEGDVLMSVQAPVGALNIATQDICIGPGLAAIRVHAEINKDYLFYVLVQISDGLIGSSGAIFNSINKQQIENIEFPLPPLAEQQRIVAKLDAAFAEIDKAIEAVEDIKKNLDAAFEKILDVSTQHQTPTVKLKDVCDIQAKLISPKDEPYCNEPHIGAGNIVSMSNELVDVLSAKEEGLISRKFPFDTDSVLYSKIRPYLRKVHLPIHTGICSADMYPLIPDAKILDRKYLYHLLLSQTFTDYAMSGSARAGMPKVNRNHLFDFEFQLPELDVQKLIVKKMEAIFFESSKLQRINYTKITQIEALKSSILAQELQREAA